MTPRRMRALCLVWLGMYLVMQPAPSIAATEIILRLPLILKGPSAPQQDPLPLEQVRFWGYQLQGLEDEGAVDVLVASHYDLLVLEPTRTDWSSQESRDFDTAGMVRRLKNSFASDGVHRKRVIAYVDIGEAEDWRWYWTWSTAWDCRPPMPTDWLPYILACDPDGWGGNYPVAYWHPDWKDIIIYGRNRQPQPGRGFVSALDELLQDGFDGIYLDWVEGYEDAAVVRAAPKAGVDPAAEMIALIREIRDYARARQPGFVVIQQNAAALSEGHPELYGLIDAIAQEAVWYDGIATDAWEDPAGYDAPQEADLTAYYITYLEPYLKAGLPVLVCEYALHHAASAYANAYRQGYIPYVTRRSLGALTTTPPPGYPG